MLREVNDEDGNFTFTTFATPTAAGFTTSPNYLDGIGDRLMFRLAYRNFGDHESLVGNYTVKSNNVAGIRWFELAESPPGQ